jgi:hypothetical protein
MSENDDSTVRKIDSLADTVEEIRSRVERIDDSLRGNGRRGLYTEVALIDERVRSVESFRREAEGLRRWFVLGILGLFGSIAWNIAETYIRST